jgi:outer membrane autotransporter protein
VAGDLTLAPGSVYQAEATADGRSDQLLVSGQATVQGATLVAVADGHWSPATRYTLVKADGGIVGRFESVQANFAFLTPTLTYTGDGLVFTLERNAVPLPSVGATPNEQASAAAIEPLVQTPIHNAEVQLDAPTARISFDQLSGELHASVKSAAMEDSRIVRDIVLDRVRHSLGGIGTSQHTQSNATDSGTVWAQAYGIRGEADGDGNATGTKRHTRGVLAGVERRIGASARAGVYGGVGHGEVDARSGRGHAGGDAWHLGVYGGAQWGALGLRGGAGTSRQSLDTLRQVAVPGLVDSLNARYSLRTLQAFGELGWRIDAGADTAFEPFASLAHVDVRGGSFAEQGLGSGAALSGRSSGMHSSFATVGLRAETRVSLGGVQARLRGSAGWRKVVGGDTDPGADLAFYGLSRFNVQGTPIARQAFVVDAGIDVQLRRDLSLGLSYTGQSGGGSRVHGAKVDLVWKF